MKKTVGMMIQDTLIKKNISLQALGRGLCSQSATSKYLNGKLRMDRLLLTVFLQRIGKSPSKFISLLSEAEFAYFEWRREICLAQRNCDWKRVEYLLKESVAKDRSCNEVLQEQFFRIMQSMVIENLYHDKERSTRILASAIEKTVPEFQKGLKADTLLGVQEINAILLWQNLQPDKIHSGKVLKDLLYYIEKRYEDGQELARVYPQVAAEYLNILVKNGDDWQCLALAERIIGMMIATGNTLFMETVLGIFIETAERLGITHKVNIRRKQLQAWRELLRDINYVAEKPLEQLFMLDIWQEMELIHEAIRVTRKEKGYSQEKLSESICTPETMSRIETGKQVPQRNIYNILVQKLSLPEEYYFSIITTDDFEVLELQWWLDVLVMGKSWNEAKVVHKKLKSMLDKEERNMQYIEEIQYSIEKGLGELPREGRMGRLISILRYTLPNVNRGDWRTETFWKHHFSIEEMHILIKIADVLFMRGEVEEEIELLENILQYYKKSKVAYEWHYGIIMLVIARLTSVYSELKNYTETLRYAEEGIRISFICGNTKMLASLVNNKADTLERIGNKDASLQYYKLAFYCADLMNLETKDVSKRSYEKLSGKEKKWY